jgi:hypothetical protein
LGSRCRPIWTPECGWFPAGPGFCPIATMPPFAGSGLQAGGGGSEDDTPARRGPKPVLVPRQASPSLSQREAEGGPIHAPDDAHLQPHRPTAASCPTSASAGRLRRPKIPGHQGKLLASSAPQTFPMGRRPSIGNVGPLWYTRRRHATADNTDQLKGLHYDAGLDLTQRRCRSHSRCGSSMGTPTPNDG